MKIQVKGKAWLTLNQSDYVGSGGQCDLYTKGGTAFKIYHNAKGTIPSAKIQELQVLTQPNIIKPEEIILNERNQEIGYTMKYIGDTYTLCQIFPKGFRLRNNLNPNQTANLVQLLRNGVEHVHKNKVLIVDLNEMNFLVSKDFKEIYFIDVDSYQTGSFAATAIMESIRDRSVIDNRWSEASDWYSFAIISYQMFRGIHPFKGGRHKNNLNMEQRMLRNISILNPNVSFPANAVLSESVIPQNYSDWYEEVFEKGKRLPPPSDFVSTILIQTVDRKISSGKHIKFEELLAGKGMVRIVRDGLVITNKGVVLKNKFYLMIVDDVVFTPKFDTAIALQGAKLLNLLDGAIVSNLSFDDYMVCNKNLYIKEGSTISKVEFIEGAASPSPKLKTFSKIVAYVLPHSFSFFDEVGYQRLGKANHFMIFDHFNVFDYNLVETLGMRIIDGRHRNGVLVVIGEDKGVYTRFVYKLKGAAHKLFYKTHDEVINFSCLDNGVVILCNEEGNLEVFHNQIKRSEMKIVLDKGATAGIIEKDGARALLANGEALYKISLEH